MCLCVSSVVYCVMLCGACLFVFVCLPLSFNAFVCFVFIVLCGVVWCVFFCVLRAFVFSFVFSCVCVVCL